MGGSRFKFQCGQRKRKKNLPVKKMPEINNIDFQCMKISTVLSA